jgi:hypothetical protein
MIMAAEATKTEENRDVRIFTQMLPPKSEPAMFFKEAKKMNTDNVSKAVRAFRDAIALFGVTNTEIAKALDEIERDSPKSTSVFFGKGMATPSRAGADLVYSVRIEVNGAAQIFSLRVGKEFTELSYERNGKFVEILRQEKNEVIHQKF